MRRLTICIIEDDIAQSEALRRFLSRRGFEDIVVHASAAEVYRWLNLHKPHIALLDINLEENGIGYGVMASLSNLGVPTIVMTSRRTVFESNAALIGGAVHFMRKPFDPQSLLNLINTIIKLTYPTYITSDQQPKDIEHIEDMLWLDNLSNLIVDDSVKPQVIINFTPVQHDFLRLFAKSSNLPLSRAEILNKIWGGQIGKGTLYTIVHRINKTFEKAGSDYRISNVERSRNPNTSFYRVVKLKK